MSIAQYPPPSLSTSARPFFDSFWNTESIGIFSSEYRFSDMEEHTPYSISFYRGNVKVYVFSDAINTSSTIRDNKIDYNLLSQIFETPLNPDPREVAWRIDQYLKGDPLEKVNEEEKQKLKTLEIKLPKDVDFEQGKEYSFDFPRRLSDGTIPSEIRLVVSRGEIQQVVDQKTVENTNIFPNPASLSPDVNGNYTVLFGQSGKQTIHCYHINEEGKCSAWGKTEVSVKTTTNPKSKGENK
jgi:hypothetical protein